MQREIQGSSEGTLIFETIPEKILGAHPTMLLGKTSSCMKDVRKNKRVYLSLYPKRLLSIASGATPIGSTGRAPGEISFSRII
jgi:hypothetical protein